MKNALKILVIALTTLAFSGVGFAQAKPTTPATPAAPATEKKTEMKPEKAKIIRTTGEVTAVDAKAGTLTVKEKDKETNVIADSKAAKSALSKIKIGDMVRLSYTEKDGKMIASSIVKTKATAKKPEKATEKKAESK